MSDALLDTIVIGLGVLVQAVTAYLGFHVTVSPITTVREKRIYQAIFIGLFVLAASVAGWQQHRTNVASQRATEVQEETNKRLLSIQEQTKEPPIVRPLIHIPPASPPVITVTPPQPLRRLPLPRYPLGGDMGVEFGPQQDWFPIFNHVDVELDWSTLGDIDAMVELTYSARRISRTETDGGALAVRLKSVTFGTFVAQDKWFFSSGEFTGRVPIPRGVGAEKYRLEILPTGPVAVAVAASVVLSWQPKSKP
jgi:hypothetical protein